MSVRIQRIWGVALVVLAVFLAVFCTTFLTANAAFADAADEDPIAEATPGQTGDEQDTSINTNDADQTAGIEAESEPETCYVTVTKSWVESDGATAADAPAGASVTLQLFADNVDYGEPVTVSAANGWAHTWAGLPKASGKTGRDVVYTVRETGCSASDFELASIGGDMNKGLVVTNKKKASPIAHTGDDTNFGLIAGIVVAGVALVGAGAALVVRRNKNKD